ncbi:MAG: class I SAM-dependent methyltransferase [Sporichthyaceae bacterium]
MDSAEWDARYQAEPLLWGMEPNQFVHDRLFSVEPGVAVDLACGNGRNAVWLAGCGWKVTGVDISGVALGQAAQRAEQVGVEVDWVQADARTWSPPGPVDLMLVAYLHLPVPELIQVLARAGELLTPEGRLLYVGHSRTNFTRGFGGPSDPAVLIEIAELAEAAQTLRVRELAHVLRDTEAGPAVDIVLDASPWHAGELVEGSRASGGEWRTKLGDAHPGVTKAGGR